MTHFDKTLRTYAENGLRTVEDWTSISRDILPGQTPRAEADIRGRKIPLYVREQTAHRPARTRIPRPAAPVATPAAPLATPAADAAPANA